ncbi:MAG TPA: holo-ACP synthase [Acidimicrobiales bacterium]|nr:holo-ACP synthase [Acidimicrobiales bacterium]
MSGLGGAGIVGVGIDAVDVDRFRLALQRRPRLADRLFTDGERADAAVSGNPAERLAARFAAKEATMKALGSGIGSFALRDVEVVRSPGTGPTSGAPSLRLAAAAAELADRRQVARWHVSLTHTSQVAIAMVVAEGVPAPAVAGVGTAEGQG